MASKTQCAIVFSCSNFSSKGASLFVSVLSFDMAHFSCTAAVVTKATSGHEMTSFLLEQVTAKKKQRNRIDIYAVCIILFCFDDCCSFDFCFFLTDNFLGHFQNDDISFIVFLFFTIHYTSHRRTQSSFFVQRLHFNIKT